MNEIKEQKKLVRSKILIQRKELSNEFIQENSEIILSKTKNKIDLNNVRNIHIYLPLKGEVDTTNIINELLIQNINVYFSRLDKSDSKISKYRLIKLNSELRETFVRRFPFFELIVIPGVAFDQNMNRLGFGGGFYDRFLSKRQKSLKIGLAFDFQVISSIPTEKTDQKMDLLITEKRVFE